VGDSFGKKRTLLLVLVVFWNVVRSGASWLREALTQKGAG